MSGTLKMAVLSAVLLLLRPLVKLLLDAGIGVGEFHLLAKRAYVQVARDRLDEGRPNISRIAVLTGISRAEIGAILAEPPDAKPTAERGRHRAEHVLHGWWTDPQYGDPSGRPLRLPLRGGRRSFTSLVKRYAGDPRTLTLLDELLRVKAVRQHPDGQIEALSRTVATARWDSNGVIAIGERIRDLLETLIHNIEHPSRPRYERFVASNQVDPRYVPMLMRDISQQANAMAESLQDSLNDPAHTVKGSDTPHDARRLGVAIYVVENETIVEAATAARPATKRRRG